MKYILCLTLSLFFTGCLMPDHGQHSYMLTNAYTVKSKTIDDNTKKYKFSAINTLANYKGAVKRIRIYYYINDGTKYNLNNSKRYKSKAIKTSKTNFECILNSNLDIHKFRIFAELTHPKYLHATAKSYSVRCTIVLNVKNLPSVQLSVSKSKIKQGEKFIIYLSNNLKGNREVNFDIKKLETKFKFMSASIKQKISVYHFQAIALGQYKFDSSYLLNLPEGLKITEASLIVE